MRIANGQSVILSERACKGPIRTESRDAHPSTINGEHRIGRGQLDRDGLSIGAQLRERQTRRAAPLRRPYKLVRIGTHRQRFAVATDAVEPNVLMRCEQLQVAVDDPKCDAIRGSALRPFEIAQRAVNAEHLLHEHECARRNNIAGGERNLLAPIESDRLVLLCAGVVLKAGDDPIVRPRNGDRRIGRRLGALINAE